MAFLSSSNMEQGPRLPWLFLVRIFISGLGPYRSCLRLRSPTKIPARVLLLRPSHHGKRAGRSYHFLAVPFIFLVSWLFEMRRKAVVTQEFAPNGVIEFNSSLCTVEKEAQETRSCHRFGIVYTPLWVAEGLVVGGARPYQVRLQVETDSVPQ